MIRLAIVGCGAVVRHHHLPAIASLDYITVSVLCDLNLQNAEQLRSQFHSSAEVTDALDTLSGRADAALLADTPRHHAAVSIRLLEESTCAARTN